MLVIDNYLIGDDSLKRVLKQSLKNTIMLQMRVPREQDLLSVSLKKGIGKGQFGELMDYFSQDIQISAY